MVTQHILRAYNANTDSRKQYPLPPCNRLFKWSFLIACPHSGSTLMHIAQCVRIETPISNAQMIICNIFFCRYYYYLSVVFYGYTTPIFTARSNNQTNYYLNNAQPYTNCNTHVVYGHFRIIVFILRKHSPRNEGAHL